MIDLVYYSPELRVYRDGRVERLWRGLMWKFCEIKPHTTGYVEIKINKTKFKLHRIIAYCFLGLESMSFNNQNLIDHKNRIKNDNRVDNLRIVNCFQNQWNNDANGYYWNKSKKKFTALIRCNNIQTELGSFNTEEEARQAYLIAKAKYHVIAT